MGGCGWILANFKTHPPSWMRADTPPSRCSLDAGQAGKGGWQQLQTHTHTHTDHTLPKAQSSEASSICDSSKSLADIDLVPRLAAHSGRVELSGAAGRSWDHSRRRRLRPWAETHGSNSLLGLTMSPSTASQSQHRQRQINTLTHENTKPHINTCIHTCPLPFAVMSVLHWM